MPIEDLKHVVRKLPGGGQVLVLNTGALITPESEAMLGALHSRSVGGINSHLEQLSRKGSAGFMATYYMGYGHKSIGDMADGRVYIEGVSMLAAKAIQDYPLYNGQESSTRYIDFGKQAFLDPLRSSESRALQESWRAFYLDGVEEMKTHLAARFPRQDHEKEVAYEKAIAAHAFDTMRGFLPAGASTDLVWSTTVRQFGDRLPVLRHHPLREVRIIARAIESALIEAFPNSFSKKRYAATEAYYEKVGRDYAYFAPDSWADTLRFRRDGVSFELLDEYREVFALRPPKTDLPYAVREIGQVEFEFLLDFGSFRDLQRNRAVATLMPLLSRRFGFEPWYLSQMPERLRTRAVALLTQNAALAERLRERAGETEETMQYYLPMGYRCPIRLVGDLRAVTYLLELRTTRFIHVTLRRAMREAAERFSRELSLPLHLDEEPDRFDIARGTQDIVAKDGS